MRERSDNMIAYWMRYLDEDFKTIYEVFDEECDDVRDYFDGLVKDVGFVAVDCTDIMKTTFNNSDATLHKSIFVENDNEDDFKYFCISKIFIPDELKKYYQ